MATEEDRFINIEYHAELPQCKSKIAQKGFDLQQVVEREHHPLVVCIDDLCQAPLQSALVLSCAPVQVLHFCPQTVSALWGGGAKEKQEVRMIDEYKCEGAQQVPSDHPPACDDCELSPRSVCHAVDDLVIPDPDMNRDPVCLCEVASCFPYVIMGSTSECLSNIPEKDCKGYEGMWMEGIEDDADLYQACWDRSTRSYGKHKALSRRTRKIRNARGVGSGQPLFYELEKCVEPKGTSQDVT